MQPYYSDSEVQFYNQDCIAGMKELDENTGHVIFTSPPYNVGKEYEKGEAYGNYLKLLSDMYEAGFHCIKPGGYFVINFADYYIHFGGENAQIMPTVYLHHILAEHAGWVHMCTRIWQKEFAKLTDPWTAQSNNPKQEHEWIMTFRKPGGGKEKIREQVYHAHSIWSTVGKKQEVITMKNHTAAFPEHLVKMVLDVYTDQGDTVIEPFLGSGTTLFVAKKMGRKGIGFELSEEHCVDCKTRLSQSAMNFDSGDGTILNPGLFENDPPF